MNLPINNSGISNSEPMRGVNEESLPTVQEVIEKFGGGINKAKPTTPSEDMRELKYTSDIPKNLQPFLIHTKQNLNTLRVIDKTLVPPESTGNEGLKVVDDKTLVGDDLEGMGHEKYPVIQEGASQTRKIMEENEHPFVKTDPKHLDELDEACIDYLILMDDNKTDNGLSAVILKGLEDLDNGAKEELLDLLDNKSPNPEIILKLYQDKNAPGENIIEWIARNPDLAKGALKPNQ